MKIVHVGYAHRPDDIRIFQKECLALAESGHQVFFVTSNLNCKSVEISCDKVQIILVNLRKPNHRFPYVFYWKDLKKIVSSLDADVYHFHELDTLPILLYMKKKRKKVIYDLHEDTPRQMQPAMCRKRGKVIGGLIINFFEAFENHCIRRADYIITATPHIAKRCKKLAKNVECVANYPIVYNNKVIGRSKPKEKNVCYTGEISENTLRVPTLCYCGGMSEDRNISMYVKMMEYIEGKLLLAGPLNTSYKQYLSDIKSWKKVEYLGYLDRAGVNDLYEKSDIGLCILRNTPNIYYSYPIKLFEYMEAGLPVICSDFPIWREIVEGCKCGMVVPCDDMAQALKAIRYILEHPAVAAQMGENGKRAVREKYNWQSEEKKLIEVYHKMANVC